MYISTIHSLESLEKLKEAGIPEGLVRVSAGLENKEDILADVEQALAQI